MRQKFLTIPCILFLAITVIIAGCSKDGDTGPAGPAGPAGPTGAAGAAGVPGAQGVPGTANVIYSAWLSVPFIADTFRTTGNVLDTAGFYADIAAPKLDLNMLDKGEIKVYVNFGSAAEPFVFPLPYIGGNGLYIDVAFSLNTISIYSNGNLTPVPIRYFLVPGGTAARPTAGGKTVDWNNYKEVQAYLGLKD